MVQPRLTVPCASAFSYAASAPSVVRGAYTPARPAIPVRSVMLVQADAFDVVPRRGLVAQVALVDLGARLPDNAR